MRRFVCFTAACALVALTGLAQAQHIDFAVGGSSLFAPKPTSASVAYPPPPEKGGSYASLTGSVMFENRFGFNIEAATRSDQALYDGYQRYRPVLYDVNGVFSPHLPWGHGRMTADLMAGFGGETILFYNQFSRCNYNGGSCPTYANSDHFLLHAGVGVRYYFLRNLFVRPEAHLYFVPNNFEFHTDYFFRVGASVGYTWGQR